MWRRLKPVLLVTLVGGGALGGLLVCHLLTSYEAQFSLPIDLITYRSNETNLESEQEFRRFGTATGKSQTATFQRLESAMSSGRTAASSHIRYEAVPRFKKRDWRDIPDALLSHIVTKEIGGKEKERDERGRPQSAPQAPTVKADANVSGFGPDPQTAREAAVLAMDFLRHTFYLAGLRQQFQSWGPNSSVELARTSEKINQTQTELLSTERKLASISIVRDRYKDLREISPAVASGVQVHVSNAKNLSPVQQAIGLEIDRIEANELLSDAKLMMAYYRHLTELAGEFSPKLEGGEAPMAIASQLRERLAALKVGDEATARLALERARATVDVALAELKARWSDTRSDPDEPLVRAIGPRRLFGLVGGALLGLVLWLAVLLHRKALAQLEGVLADVLPQQSPRSASGT